MNQLEQIALLIFTLLFYFFVVWMLLNKGSDHADKEDDEEQIKFLQEYSERKGKGNGRC